MGLLELSAPVQFEPVGPVTTIFFDDKNQQVFSVRSGGATGVTAKSPHGAATVTLRIRDLGPISSVKLSPCLATLAVQRAGSKGQVDFVPVGQPEAEFSQPARAKGCSVLGLVWTSPTELVYVTDLGLELYSVAPERRTTKYLRGAAAPVAWFLACPQESFIATAPTAEAKALQVWAVRGGTCYKLGSVEGAAGRVVREQEAAMVSVYGASYLAVSPPPGEAGPVLLHRLGQDVVTPSHSLLLPGAAPGPLGIQVVDNLVVVHSLAEGRSRVFDLQQETAARPAGEGPAALEPALPPTALCLAGSGCSQALPYSAHWVVSRPAVLVEPRAGLMWAVRLRLEEAADTGPPLAAAGLLLNRSAGKAPLLRLLRTCVASPGLPLPALGQLLRLVVAALHRHLVPAGGPPPVVVLDQPDLFTQLFPPAGRPGEPEVPVDRQLAALLELLLCLAERAIPPRQFLHQLLIQLVVRAGKFYQLHQLLQYGAVGDSKPVACLLLSLEGSYRPARQLALDMMARLGTATEEIIEIFLAEGKLIPALQLVRAHGLVDSVSARKFLEAADKTGDRMVFFNVFSFFEERNLRLRGSGKFSRGEQCEQYVQKFRTTFLGGADTGPAAGAP